MTYFDDKYLGRQVQVVGNGAYAKGCFGIVVPWSDTERGPMDVVKIELEDGDWMIYGPDDLELLNDEPGIDPLPLPE